MPPPEKPLTIVALHAHPDDETLLTGGTLARAAAEGNRVIVITCTDGGAGLSADVADLAVRRRAEAQAAAQILGCERWLGLGYLDSGSDPAGPVPGSFATLDPLGPATRVAEVLTAEGADLLISYDAHGGYGHRDHKQVHRVGALAASLAETPLVWEATVDGNLMRRLTGLLARLPVLRGLLPPPAEAAWTSAAAIDHVLDVRDQVATKQAALRAHRSQFTGHRVRTVRVLAGLPGPLARLVLGREWFRTATGGLPSIPSTATD